jgi:hypothetical protein
MPTKHEYDKALFRLSTISTMLVRDHRPNIKDLALEFNVTVKTIQNDLYKRLHMYDIAKDEFGRLILKNKHISEIEFFKELKFENINETTFSQLDPIIVNQILKLIQEGQRKLKKKTNSDMTINNITNNIVKDIDNNINCKQQLNAPEVLSSELVVQDTKLNQQRGDIDTMAEHSFFYWDDEEYETEPFEDESLIYLYNFNTAIKINDDDKFIMAYDLNLDTLLAQEYTGGKLVEICQELANEIYEHLANITTANKPNAFLYSCDDNNHQESATKQKTTEVSSILSSYGISIIEEKYDLSPIDVYEQNIYWSEY